MSNEAVLVKFGDGEVYFTGYHGCSSAAHEIIYGNKEQLFINAFSDPEEEKVSDDATSHEEIEKFMLERSTRDYGDIENVQLFAPYSGGSLWKAKASKSGNIILSGYSNIEDNTSIDFDNADDWPEWVKNTGIPEKRSLMKDQWIEIN